MGNFVGTLIGAAIDRRDGDSGIKGAIIGSLLQRTAKIALPLAITAAVGWGALRLVRDAASRAAKAVKPEPSAEEIFVATERGR